MVSRMHQILIMVNTLTTLTHPNSPIALRRLQWRLRYKFTLKKREQSNHYSIFAIFSDRKIRQFYKIFCLFLGIDGRIVFYNIKQNLQKDLLTPKGLYDATLRKVSIRCCTGPIQHCVLIAFVSCFQIIIIIN